MMKRKTIILLMCLVIILCFYGCGKNVKSNDFWENRQSSSEITDLTSSDFVVSPVSDEEMQKYKHSTNLILGEKCYSKNYDKNMIIFPDVKSEETIKGEKWFPPINNSTPIDEIAPVISYELMCDGLYISPFYPQNPENYTAQALNENAFPINFFRKINDLYYYTVCKVEGGGYMYYFFMANSNVTIEKAAKVHDDMLSYDKEGNMIIEEPYHLFNAELADMNNRDLTKEVIWRGSVYSNNNINSVDAFAEVLNDIGKGDDYFDRSVEYYINSDANFKVITDIMPKLYFNIVNGEDLSYSVAHSKYTGLMPLCQGAPRMILLGKDGFITVNTAPSEKNGVYESKKISELSMEDIMKYLQVNSIYSRKNDNMWGKVFNYSDNSYTWYVTEENSIFIEILPQDYK